MSQSSWEICKIVEEALKEIGIVTTIHYEARHQDKIAAVIEREIAKQPTKKNQWNNYGIM
jgi:hypothetical protein